MQAQTLLAHEIRFNEWKKQFRLFLENKNIWRCGGKLDNTDLQYAAKHSMFLSKHHHLTVLIIRSAHEKVFHNGMEDRSEPNTGLYIQGRSLVSSIIL